MLATKFSLNILRNVTQLSGHYTPINPTQTSGPIANGFADGNLKCEFYTLSRPNH